MLNTLVDYSKVIKDIHDNKIMDYCESPYFIGVANKQDPNVFVFDYNQIESKRFAPGTDFFRGLVLQDNQILCLPYPRSYNVQEDIKNFMSINEQIGTSYTLEEKVDGSLIKVYRNKDNVWTIATRGTSVGNSSIWSADILNPIDPITYEELFLKTLQLTNDQFQDWCDLFYKRSGLNTHVKGFTILFELCTKLNKVVVSYPEDCVYIHGYSYYYTLPDNVTSRFMVVKSFNIDLEVLPKINILKPEVILFKQPNYGATKEEIYQAIDDALIAHFKDGKLVEGCIITQTTSSGQAFYKYKTNSYVIAHRMRGNKSTLTLDDAIELWIEGEQHEFLGYFPEYYKIFEDIEKIVSNVELEVKTLLAEWDKLTKDEVGFLDAKVLKKQFVMKYRSVTYFNSLVYMHEHRDTNLRDWLNKSFPAARFKFFTKELEKLD